MIDLTKKSFLEEYTARMIGVAIGLSQGKKFAQKTYEARRHQEKLRRDAEFKRYQEISGD